MILSARLRSSKVSPVCATAATTNPARASAWAVSKWSVSEPPVPWLTTINAWPPPATGAPCATTWLPSARGSEASGAALGYQIDILIGRSPATGTLTVS